MRQENDSDKEFMKSMMGQTNSFIQDIMKAIIPIAWSQSPQSMPVVQLTALELMDIEERKFNLKVKEFEFNKELERERRDKATWEINHLAHQTKMSPQELAVEKHHERILGLIEVLHPKAE
jgi:hypothetical protein